MTWHTLDQRTFRLRGVFPAAILTALAAVCLSSCTSSGPRSEATQGARLRTSYSRTIVNGISTRMVVEHDVSIPPAAALSVTERATQLIQNPDPAVAATCEDLMRPDGKTWQKVSFRLWMWLRVLARVSRLDGHRLMPNENGMIAVVFSGLANSDLIVEFEPAAGGRDAWSLKCFGLKRISSPASTAQGGSIFGRGAAATGVP